MKVPQRSRAVQRTATPPTTAPLGLSPASLFVLAMTAIAYEIAERPVDLELARARAGLEGLEAALAVVVADEERDDVVRALLAGFEPWAALHESGALFATSDPSHQADPGMVSICLAAAVVVRLRYRSGADLERFVPEVLAELGMSEPEMSRGEMEVIGLVRLFMQEARQLSVVVEPVLVSVADIVEAIGELVPVEELRAFVLRVVVGLADAKVRRRLGC